MSFVPLQAFNHERPPLPSVSILFTKGSLLQSFLEKHKKKESIAVALFSPNLSHPTE